MNKFFTAVRLLKRDGLTETVEAVADFYIEKMPKTGGIVAKITLLPLLVLEQFHLLLTEGAIAYPVDANNWVVYDLRRQERTRNIISPFDRVSGTLHGSSQHLNIMQTIYTCEGFVEIEEGDVVVDIGAYVGAFSKGFSSDASQIFAVEPQAKVSDALNENMRQLDNVSVVPKAAWNEQGVIEINQSFFPADNSILKPDQHKLGRSFTVETDTVPNIVTQAGVNTVDYLKIEAEGAEPEILQASLESDVPFNKIAIDVSEKRETNQIEDSVVELLEQNGYEWQKKSNSTWWGDKVIFAKKS